MKETHFCKKATPRIFLQKSAEKTTEKSRSIGLKIHTPASSSRRCSIWFNLKCNAKFKNDKKCTTPHLSEAEIKRRFMIAANWLLTGKNNLATDFDAIKRVLFGTSALEVERFEKAKSRFTELTEQIQERTTVKRRAAESFLAVTLEKHRSPSSTSSSGMPQLKRQRYIMTVGLYSGSKTEQR